MHCFTCSLYFLGYNSLSEQVIPLFNTNIYLKSNIQCISKYEFSGLYTIWLFNVMLKHIKCFVHVKHSSYLVLLVPG